MPLGMRKEYLPPQIIFVGSRNLIVAAEVSPLLHCTISAVALAYQHSMTEVAHLEPLTGSILESNVRIRRNFFCKP
jgi:hypothetical protein